MTVSCIEKILRNTHAQLELIEEFNKVTGYKIDIQKYIVFLCKLMNDLKIKKTSLFTVVSKNSSNDTKI